MKRLDKRIGQLLGRRRRAPYRHGPVAGNTLELVAGGARFYEQLAREIAAARHELLIGTYLWEDDETGRRFLRLLGDAARRGLSVVLLLDGVGSRAITLGGLAAASAGGVRLAHHHALRFPLIERRLLRRYHCKLTLIDGRVAFTGGMGFGAGWSAAPPVEWWDVMARLTGPIVPRLRELFAADWRTTTGEELPPLADGATAAPTATGGEVLHPLVTRWGRSELRRRLLAAIRGAHDRVAIASAYFVPGLRIRRALRRAAGRGVDVRLLLPGRRTDHFAVWNAGRRHYQGLLRHGVRIHEWQRGMFHAKYAVVDDTWACIGSSNLDNWSVRFNHELDVGIESPAAVAAIAARFDTDLGETREIGLAQWQARPWTLRVAETFFGWFDPLL